jgi:protein-tyrosine-phosphatase
MAAAIAGSRLEGAGPIEVSSAGLMREGMPPTAEMLQVMTSRGFDLSSHRSRHFEDALHPAPDLVVTMGAEQARRVVDHDPNLFGRTFLLKDLVRRATAAGRRRSGEGLPAYLERISEGRRISELTDLSGRDDVKDPIGRPLAEYERCAQELDSLVSRLVEYLWPG